MDILVTHIGHVYTLVCLRSIVQNVKHFIEFLFSSLKLLFSLVSSSSPLLSCPYTLSLSDALPPLLCSIHVPPQHAISLIHVIVALLICATDITVHQVKLEPRCEHVLLNDSKIICPLLHPLIVFPLSPLSSALSQIRIFKPRSHCSLLSHLSAIVPIFFYIHHHIIFFLQQALCYLNKLQCSRYHLIQTAYMLYSVEFLHFALHFL